MRRMLTRALLAGVIAITAGGAVGCAQERAPINRVQANALAKSFFVGADLKDPGDDPEFHMRNTVVDVGYGAAQDGLFTSTYAQPVSRIRWQITESHLIARLAYERIQDSDAKGLLHDGLVKKTTEDGQIVASYRITSHFDIRRAYNPATGEESNIVEENTSDRTWDQREFMRVDWSENESSGAYDFDTLSMMGLYGGIKYSPLSYSVLDPADPDAPHFDADSGYFDITNKAYAEPALLDLSSLGWGVDTFPACMLPGDFAGGTDPYGNCNPTEITLRQSFRKVVDHDYEAQNVDGYRFEAYGDFQTEYKGYERNYGMVDDRWFRFGDRYNIWERSHFYTDPDKMTGEIACDTRKTTIDSTNDPSADPNRDLDGDGTADECKAAGKGSRCDVFKGKCTLPYSARKAITIPWYVNGASTAQIDNFNWQIETEKAKDSPDQSKIDDLNKQIAAAQKAGEDLFEATDWAVQEWDLAMKTAVQSARLVECRKTGGGDACSTKYPMWNGQQDDIDEAVEISRSLNACYRSKGWESTDCINAAKAQANALPEGVGEVSKTGIASVVGQQSVIVLCHNPVIKGDHPACGEEGLSPRLGDLRYNTVLNIDKAQQPSAWGIMVDGDDPVTGEKVAASINIWTHITDVASQGLVDLVRYMNGELSISQITEGKYIQDWTAAQKAAGGAAGSGPLMSRDEVNARLASASKVDSKTYAELTKNGVSPQVRDIIAQGKVKLGDVAIDSDVASPSQAGIVARMNKARGSEAEAQLMNGPMLQMAGVTGNVPLKGAIADMASPLGMNNPKVRSQLAQMRSNALAARGACIINEAPEASSLTGIADLMKKKFPIGANETAVDRQNRYEQMVRYIRRKYHYAVLAHEMGHSIGLRHNFVSTYASLFYRPQYWQLRTKNGKVTKECTDATDDGNSCTGPRYFDPVTDEEQSQLIWQYMQSTVMDYPGDVSQDMIGLGVYDFGAARFFYGDTVSVYDASLGKDYQAGGKVGVGVTLATDTFGGLSGINYGLKGTQGADDFHYSQLQKNYKVIDKCYDVTPTAPKWWNAAVDGEWDPTLDGHVVTVDGKVQKCRQMPVDYASYAQLRMPDLKWDTTKNQYVPDAKTPETNKGFYRGGPSILDTNKLDTKAAKLIRVPYAFATDHWADTGNVSVFRHDNGADPYEQTMFLITTQENRHIFDNYRRNRTTFNVRAAADRSFSRYNEKLLGISGGIGFYGTIYQDLSINQGFSFDTLWPLIVEGSLKGNILAATVAFDHFTRELSRPEPGVHYYKDPAVNDPVLHSDSDADDYGAGANFGPGAANSAEIVRIPNGATGYLRDIGFGGHPIENGLAQDKGDYDSNYTINSGAYYEKINTAILLSESEDRFISESRRDFYDARFRAVGMADVLPEGYRRVLANALTGDRSMLAPRLESNKSADPTKRKPILDAAADTTRDPDAKKYPKRPIGWTSWWPTEGPAVCFPTNGKNICTDYLGGDLKPNALPNDQMALIDPQIGWEVQKFLIAWTLAYIPANQKSTWIDQMKIYRVGSDADPQLPNRIEWQDPVSGNLYYAITYGKECLFGDNSATDKASCSASGGQWVQKGIAARVLEWANQLTAGGYSLDCTDGSLPSCPNPVCSVQQLDKNLPDYCPAPVLTATPDGFNKFGRAMVRRFNDGTPAVKPDPAIKDWNAAGNGLIAIAACDPDQFSFPLNKPLNGCKPLPLDKNHYATQLSNYKAVPDYIRQVGIEYGVFDSHELGVYP